LFYVEASANAGCLVGRACSVRFSGKGNEDLVFTVYVLEGVGIQEF
jgi:hypothetical protein